MLENSNDTSILNKFNNAGPITDAPPMKLPNTGVLEPKGNRFDVPSVGILPIINSNDYNVNHDTEAVNPDDPGLFDYDAFTGRDISHEIFMKAYKHKVFGIPGKVIENRRAYKQQSNFAGGATSIDYMGLTPEERKNYQNFLRDLTPSELDEYNDFLGINFKKIGHALGSAGQAVGHAIGSAGQAVGHALGSAGQAVGHAVAWTGTEIGHGAKYIAKPLGRALVWTGKQTWKYLPYLAAAAALAVGQPEISAAILAIATAMKNDGASDAEVDAALKAQGLPAIFGGNGDGGLGADFGDEGLEGTDDGVTDDGQTLDGTGIDVQADANARVTLSTHHINKVWYWAGGFALLALIYWYYRHHHHKK